MPEITDGGRIYTMQAEEGHLLRRRSRRSTGKKRELVAQRLRVRDQAAHRSRVRSPNLWLIEGRIEGIEAAAAKAKKDGKLRLRRADRRASRCSTATRCASASPSPTTTSSTSSPWPTLGAQAREVVERYGADIGAHPVGTGPFRLEGVEALLEDRAREESRTSARCTTRPSRRRTTRSRSSSTREMKGKRLPQLDRVEISDHRGVAAALARVPQQRARLDQPAATSSSNMALPGGKLAPWLEKRGMRYMPEHRSGRHLPVLQHEGPGRRRLHAGEGGAAPRDRRSPTTTRRR